MIDYKKAILIIKKNKIKINSETILSINSINRVSSSNVYSPSNYPAANNSSFDGYAINSKETKNLTKKKFEKFKILKIIAAGDNPNIKKVPKYSTIEVMTGAMIQKPFDTVIPIEQINFVRSKDGTRYIIINKKIRKNEFIRFKGSDYKKGELIVKKGQLIEPKHILAMKALGVKKISVKKKINIIFYSTGNEITNKEQIPPWKIRNSNSFYLNSLTKIMPVTFKEKNILRDNDERKFQKELMRNIKSKTDIIVTSGAVSAGKYDFIPKIIKKFKLLSYFKGVAIRPGKPITFAKLRKNKVFFGLPGNPISSAACFRFFVVPFLFNSLEMKKEKPIFAKLKNSFIKKKFFTRFIKGKLETTKKGIVEFKVLKGQESFRINSLTKANSWGVFNIGKSYFKKGNVIECYPSVPFLI